MCVYVYINHFAAIIVNRLHLNKNILENKQYLKVEKRKTHNSIENGVRDMNEHVHEKM